MCDLRMSKDLCDHGVSVNIMVMRNTNAARARLEHQKISTQTNIVIRVTKLETLRLDTFCLSICPDAHGTSRKDTCHTFVRFYEALSMYMGTSRCRNGRKQNCRTDMCLSHSCNMPM